MVKSRKVDFVLKNERTVRKIMTDTEKKSLYEHFEAVTIKDLEAALIAAKTHEEKAFYRALLNLKLQISQEKLIGKVLI